MLELDVRYVNAQSSINPWARANNKEGIRHKEICTMAKEIVSHNFAKHKTFNMTSVILKEQF